eukprot:gene20176-22151_t
METEPTASEEQKASGANTEAIELQEKEDDEGDKLIKNEEKKKKPDSPTTEKDDSAPIEKAFFFSKYVTFWWMNSLFSIGAKEPLKPEHLPNIPKIDKSESLCEKLEREWEKQLYNADGNRNNNASLMKSFIKTFGLHYMSLAIFVALSEGLRIVQPIFLGLLIGYFEPTSKTTKKEAYLYAMAMLLCSMGITLNLVPFNFHRQRMGMHARVAVTSLVYKKVLTLSNAALAKTTTGYIVNLVSSDAQKMDFAAYFLHYLWVGPIEIIVVSYLLYRQIGWPCFVGIGLLLLLAPAQMGMGRLLMRFRRKVMKYTDERVKIMNEVISGMRVIKLYTWEKSFSDMLGKIRSNEIKAIRNLAYLRACFMSFFFSSGSLISFVTFMTYVLTGSYLTSQKVFTCISFFNAARMIMTLYFPIGITMLNEARVAMERIQKLLFMEDIVKPGGGASNLRPKPADCGVKIENLSASWTKDAKTLEDITLNVEAAELCAVIGPVGCGKSSLLMAALSELPAQEGSVRVKGKISYAPQQPWVFNGSLKYNITFGQEYDEEKYKEVLKVCALERDVQLLPEGDMTLVGERGVSLSGGQRARVNLARAVYNDADVYILDDPLSAVDASVGRHLFNQCIMGYLAKKPRILVTHQLQYLTDADNIIALSEGKCIGQGTFYELVDMGIDFMSLLEEEEDFDSAIDSGDETSREVLKRRFSQQMSCVGDNWKPRADTLLRQESRAHRETNMMQSEISIAGETQEVEVYEEDNIPKETKMEGSIGWSTFLNFFRAGYGVFVWALVFLLFVICQAVYLCADWWLSYWSNVEGKYYYTRNPADKNENRNRDLGIYAALVISLVVLGLTRALVFFRVILEASKRLHGSMFSAVLRAPIYFFDTNSIGRILNRFSKDMSLVDDMLAFTFFDFCQTGLVVIGILILVAANNPIVFAVVVPIVIVFVIIRQYYIKTAREVKRIEGLMRSPVFSHFSTTLLGLPTIRAFGVQPLFADLFFQTQDGHTKSWFAFLGCAAWLSFRLELLCLVFVAFVVFVCVAVAGIVPGLSAGAIGLILSYTLNITGVFQQCVRQSTDFETYMTSVERVLEYCDLEPEAPLETDKKPPNDWPSRGSILFQDLNFRYAPHLKDVLHKVSCHIHSQEKVGVCGRTGAGKSSLLSTLFRTSESNGIIKIDGVDISELGLKDLRSKISIIPQDPILFSGTMRKNIDPFDNFNDADLWNVLEEVQLKEAVQALPKKLEAEMTESGQNLSVGQRQLVCLARAILKRNKILVIDEATANVDPKTDALIQNTIREKFKDCTVLTIAHRLNTIMDSDRIMVLDAGYLKEFNEAYNLLRCRNTLLYQLVAQTGGSEAQKLFEIARKKYIERHPFKAKTSAAPAEEEMGTLDRVEDEDDEGIEASNADADADAEANGSGEGTKHEESVVEEEDAPKEDHGEEGDGQQEQPDEKQSLLIYHLNHVIAVFERVGYKIRHSSTPPVRWDVMWSFDFPFTPEFTPMLEKLDKHKMVNHLPGLGFITLKVQLATSQLRWIPKAFKMPNDKQALIAEAAKNPKSLWVQKSNAHRGIKVVNVNGLDLSAKETFVQLFVKDPLLIDGKKFDIGIYTVITSVDPLRVYIYEEEILVRFCTTNYQPLDVKDVYSYVVGDDYYAPSMMPSLQGYFNHGRFSRKQALFTYLQNTMGKNTNKLWKDIRKAVRETFIAKQVKIRENFAGYKSTHNFFELVRIDFVIDAEMNVWLMEVNMSPNLSSSVHRENSVMYEQVLYNAFAMVGIASYVQQRESDYIKEMTMNDRDIMVNSLACRRAACLIQCKPECNLCIQCLSDETKEHLQKAYSEHVNRGNYRRVLPIPKEELKSIDKQDLIPRGKNNEMMEKWFDGKCKQDTAWCQ